MLSMAEALEIKKQAEDRLFSIPGVHTVGFGAKLASGRPVGEYAIIVQVARKKSKSELSPEELIPPEINGVKTDVVESPPRKVRFAALQGGDEIIPTHSRGGEVHSNDGTLGCVARSAAVNDTAPPDIILSCRHVLYQPDKSGNIGDEVTISSCSGCCHPTVARVLDGPPINPDIDAAIARLEPGTESKAQIHGVPVKGILDLLDPNLPEPIQLEVMSMTYKVYQYGKKSGFTRGVIASIHSTTTDPEHSGQIEVAPLDRDYFTQVGDSGSVVYNDNNQIVGLHWGGDPKPPRHSYANHITRVLSTLGSFPTGAIRIATNPPDMVYRVPGVRKLPPALERVHRDLVEAGCAGQYVQLYGKHREEIRWLFEHSRHFVSAWHRSNGPHMVRAMMDLVENRIGVLPEQLGGRTWRECVHRIAGALLFTGSEQVQSDVLRYISGVASLGGRSYPEISQLLRSMAIVQD